MLRKHDFNGYLVLEIEALGGQKLEEAVTKDIDYIRSALKLGI